MLCMLMKVRDPRTNKEKQRRRDGGTKRTRERESRGRGELKLETVPGDGWRERFPYQLHFKSPGYRF